MNTNSKEEFEYPDDQMFMPTFCQLAWLLTHQCDRLYEINWLDFGTDFVSVGEAGLSVSLTVGNLLSLTRVVTFLLIL